jgi:hypothetical protein
MKPQVSIRNREKNLLMLLLLADGPLRSSAREVERQLLGRKASALLSSSKT